MVSSQRQFCKIVQYCQEHHSENTMGKLVEVLNTHERVFQIEKMIDNNPTEQDFLKMLNDAFSKTE